MQTINNFEKDNSNVNLLAVSINNSNILLFQNTQIEDLENEFALSKEPISITRDTETVKKHTKKGKKKLVRKKIKSKYSH